MFHESLAGQRFGKLVCREYLEGVGREDTYLCDCDCGGVAKFSYYYLKTLSRTHCGCGEREVKLNWKPGDKFNMLTIKQVGRRPQDTRDMLGCICDCGMKTVVKPNELFIGRSKSCGCHKVSKITTFNTLHGYTSKNYIHKRLYQIWKGMYRRCYNPSDTAYLYYGGRGIRVCEEWLDYTTFETWALSNGYSDELTIDRIDVNVGYAPENCNWATAKEQANNKRTNVYVEHQGETRTLKEWADLLNINYSVVKSRITHGWTHKESLELVERPIYRDERTLYHDYMGRTLSLLEWSKVTGISKSTIKQRLSSGWTLGQALGYEER